MCAGARPDREQHALAFVVAAAVGVRLAEVAGDDRTVDGADDLAEQDLRGFARQDVAAADATLGTHDACALQCEQDLLEVGLGESGAVGDLAHRRGCSTIAVEGERQERAAGVVTAGRNLHSGAS